MAPHYSSRLLPHSLPGHLVTACLLALLICSATLAASAETQAGAKIIRTHAIAMHGQPRYPADFERFDYTSPEARKGGSLQLHSQGTFDSLNSFIAKGTAADWLDLTYDTLTVGSADEPFTQYGLLAQAIEYPSDRSWVIFHLHPDARFHDGEPVQADDVAFTFELLMSEGNPFYSFYYADVADVEVLDKARVKFTFKPDASHEALLIIGQLPVLPRHYWQERDFAATTLEVPLGSGPYRVDSFSPGRTISYQRLEDYWAADHPVRKGSYNFDRISVDYYRDDVVALEAFKAGEYDFRRERMARLWATGYDGDPLRQGRIVMQELPHSNPAGMQAYIFNLRNPLFQDRSLRKAIGLAFDFEWANRNLFYGAYERTDSFFANSELASSGLPSKAELALLEPHRDQLPETVFSEAWEPPTASDDRNRRNLRRAKQLLDQAGYQVVDGQLLTPDRQPVRFEILLYDQAFERVSNPFVQALKKLGIDAQLRIVDTTQYINRRRNFDFDMITHVFSQSLSPGNEQREYWHSESAQTQGSRNLIGIADPVIDQLVETLIAAETRQQLLTASHALDRVLLNMHYVIPHWYSDSHRIAWWNKFSQPQVYPVYDPIFTTTLMTWWANEAEQTGP